MSNTPHDTLTPQGYSSEIIKHFSFFYQGILKSTSNENTKLKVLQIQGDYNSHTQIPYTTLKYKQNQTEKSAHSLP